MLKLQSYAEGNWISPNGKAQVLFHAVTGEPFAEASSAGLNFKGMVEYARRVGGPKLRALTFHERAGLLKRIAKHLTEKKDEFYKISAATGATKVDSWIDIEGGIGTFYVYSSKGRKEFPNETFYVDGPMENISKNGTFVGRHICVPLEGVALHINAFNFPCWGMLEKLAPTFLAGMPAIVKPATATSYLTEAMVRSIIASGILPEGALQLICGSAGDVFDHLNCQDVVTFTGSAETGKKLKAHPSVLEHSIRFNMEADSLNCCILAPDAVPGTQEFDLFVKEVAREMTVKAGQKCTAIRRTIVPQALLSAATQAISARLATLKIGDPACEGVKMGPLAGMTQLEEVRANFEKLKACSEVAFGNPAAFEVTGADAKKGAFFPPVLLVCNKPLATEAPHSIEAFGPVNTIMPYSSVDEAIELAKRGKGSLVGSLFTASNDHARAITLGTAAYHGRLVLINRDSALESTGHGSPLPHLVHGGPGRAGGGEEMGGARGVLHFMQRTALQGSPTVLSSIMNQWMRGADRPECAKHPFRLYFEEIQVGETLTTHRRTVTEADVVNFAGISGDFFYAHMDDIAARASLFEKRVAHGYFVLSAAAGLFVDPAPGPVLANYGLDTLRFVKPVYIGDTIQAKLTCKQKTAKDTPEGVVPQGVVAWEVEVLNQNNEAVALYTILTLVKRKPVV
jgi:oxepin-CoA hydrolase/3-oxo-5,6-dehydrosuberyl-CoA semialdehyde dehydrogenase